MPTANNFGNVSPAKDSPVRTALGRASPFLSSATDTWTRGTPRSVSPSSIKTVSPPPSHVVFPSPGQGEHFRIAPANNSPRADSFPKSRKIASTPLPLPTHCPPSCEMYAICLIIIFFSSPQDVMCDSRRRECTHTTGTLSSWPMKMLALLLSSSRVRRLASVLVGVSV